MPTTKGTIFINYRKDDSNWNALAIYQELQKYFSKDQIFKDFNAISPGDDFVESINSALQACDVLLVLIGKDWLNMKDETGARRLDDPHDFVRLEIAKALDRNIKVVPVLLDRTPMPKIQELPDNLDALCRRQFVEIDPTRFEDDIRKLAEAIRKVMGFSGPAAANTPASEQQHTQPQQQRTQPQQQHTQPQQQYTQPQQQYQPQQVAGSQFTRPTKPDNNLVWAILTTILCCPPLGIMSIISASKVDGLYTEGKYAEAQASANLAKKYAMWAAIIGAGIFVIYFLIIAAGGGSGYSGY